MNVLSWCPVFQCRGDVDCGSFTLYYRTLYSSLLVDVQNGIKRMAVIIDDYGASGEAFVHGCTVRHPWHRELVVRVVYWRNIAVGR